VKLKINKTKREKKRLKQSFFHIQQKLAFLSPQEVTEMLIPQEALLEEQNNNSLKVLLWN